MQFDEFNRLIRSGAEALGTAVDDLAAGRLFRYFEELKHWQKKVNLIAKGTADTEILENHFLDSLALLPLLDADPGPLLDVGSGAGFPGLVCKTLRPDRPVVLLEPRLKRVSFLRQVIRTLDLGGVSVQAERLDPSSAVVGGTAFRWVVGRAVADVSGFLSLCTRFLGGPAEVVLMKGPRYREEIDPDDPAFKRWQLIAVHGYTLPFAGRARYLLVYAGTRRDCAAAGELAGSIEPCRAGD